MQQSIKCKRTILKTEKLNTLPTMCVICIRDFGPKINSFRQHYSDPNFIRFLEKPVKWKENSTFFLLQNGRKINMTGMDNLCLQCVQPTCNYYLTVKMMQPLLGQIQIAGPFAAKEHKPLRTRYF